MKKIRNFLMSYNGALVVMNAAGTGGLIVTGLVNSDASFRASREPEEGWDRPGFDDQEGQYADEQKPGQRREKHSYHLHGSMRH